MQGQDVETEAEAAPHEVAPVAPAAPASELVQRILERIGVAEAALAKLLGDPGHPVAAEEELEIVHDYRVALRRLRSNVRILGPAYGRRKMRRSADALRDAASLTGDLRDEEVLRETLAELELAAPARAALDRWMVGRARRERGSRARVVRAIRGASEGQEAELPATLEALRLRLLAAPKRPVSDEELAWTGLDETFAAVSKRCETARGGDSDAMHRLRIAFKRLRYTSEIVRDLLPPAGWESRAESISAKLQKHLGKLHDLDEALIRMDRARGLEPRARAAVLGELRKDRDKTAARCVRELDAAAKELPNLLREPLAARAGSDGSHL